MQWGNTAVAGSVSDALPPSPPLSSVSLVVGRGGFVAQNAVSNAPVSDILRRRLEGNCRRFNGGTGGLSGHPPAKQDPNESRAPCKTALAIPLPERRSERIWHQLVILLLLAFASLTWSAMPRLRSARTSNRATNRLGDRVCEDLLPSFSVFLYHPKLRKLLGLSCWSTAL